ncbi:nuclear transport factor 2 family protein [Kitasatospora kifunensis]|uniref:SnoaL-like domain-containing protein n=1 Tax=Kitasatospora kifunensis TaxID=58351 RepID=A0A7W7R3N5_KITKI|nr:nuclear transport factor 2 family protein [Kitasatospora kifunensis]MBB4924744.1 hypothetical protein [Kitasatospora kifunensis]
MTNLQQLAEQYLATWNETDAPARRKLIDTYWAADARYTDPLVEAAGRDAIDATIGAVQGQFPGLVFTLGAGGVDAHHQLARFTWDLGAADGETLVIGFDVLVATEDGLIGAVHGFLDKVPAA